MLYLFLFHCFLAADFQLVCSSSVPRLNFQSLLNADDEYTYPSKDIYSFKRLKKITKKTTTYSSNTETNNAMDNIPSCFEDDDDDDDVEKKKNREDSHWWKKCRMLGGGQYPRVSDDLNGWIMKIRSPNDIKAERAAANLTSTETITTLNENKSTTVTRNISMFNSFDVLQMGNNDIDLVFEQSLDRLDGLHWGATQYEQKGLTMYLRNLTAT